jgi:hypothetical protein
MSHSLQVLLDSAEFAQLRSFRTPSPGFDVFDAANLHLGENRSSWILARLCETGGRHGLGRRFLDAWFEMIDGQCGTDFPLAGLEWHHSEAGVEWGTSTNRRVDILVRLLDADRQVVGILGVENKHWALEQEDQVGHYQREIAEAFPGVPSCVLFLTPDGREPETKRKVDACPWIPASWRTALEAMRAVEPNADALVEAFLQSVRRILGEEMDYYDMLDSNRSLTPLVEELYRCPETRKAILLLEKLRPRPAKLLQEVKTRSPWSQDFLETTPKSALGSNQAPTEAKWYPPELEATSDGREVSIAYSLLATGPWETDRSVQVAVLAWIDGVTGRDRLRPYREQIAANPPPSAIWDPKEELDQWYWASWAPLWVGRKHALGALLDEDRDALVAMLADAREWTFDWIRGNLRDLGWLDAGR